MLALKVSQNMTAFVIKKLPYDLSSHAGFSRKIAFIIKWSRGRAPVETLAAQRTAHASTQWTIHRLGQA